jgi:hypothetical protein
VCIYIYTMYQLDQPTKRLVEPTPSHQPRACVTVPAAHRFDPTLTRQPTLHVHEPMRLSHFPLSLSHLAISSAIFWVWLVILPHSQSFSYSELRHSLTVSSVILPIVLSHFVIPSIIFSTVNLVILATVLSSAIF